MRRARRLYGVERGVWRRGPSNHRPNSDVLCLHGTLIPTCHDSIPRTGVHNIKISRVGYDVTALTSPNVVPVLAPDVPIVGAARTGDGAVVLLRAVDVIEKLVVSSNVIELRGRLIFLGRPGLPTINRDCGPSVVAVDHALRIIWIDPQSVMIMMWRRQ